MSKMELMAWVASGLVFMTFYMKEPLRMRSLALAANVAFIAYGLLAFNEGVFSKVLPILVLHIASLMLNAMRLREELAKQGVPNNWRNLKALLLGRHDLPVGVSERMPLRSVPATGRRSAPRRLDRRTACQTCRDLAH